MDNFENWSNEHYSVRDLLQDNYGNNQIPQELEGDAFTLLSTPEASDIVINSFLRLCEGYTSWIYENGGGSVQSYVEQSISSFHAVIVD